MNLDFFGIERNSGTIAAQVSYGLADGQFRLDYQPMVNSRSGRISGVASQLRWHHPRYGLLLPDAFCHAFADDVVARESFYFVFNAVCMALKNREASSGAGDFRIALGVQPSVLVDERLGDRVEEIAGRHELHPGRFDFEIEAADDAAGLLLLNEFTEPLRSIGVRLICEGLGTARVPLAALAGMKIDGVKLDRALVHKVPACKRAGIVLGGVFDLCARLGLDVVVAGVESGAQAQWLASRVDADMLGSYVRQPQPTLDQALRS
ncbi:MULTISPECIES: EAL domain-containing protein [unclassified Burkholderia]|uniref:EAL domain-containing protein n=1 Tax=unclassified Burkholderia TaxID=2613784 RepID=UPI002ABE26CB|nr:MULTISPECIES: EAL domain-containing protein [unclassified Burkholderia]